MGVSTNGQICYGVVFEEGYEFPWGKDGEDGGIEDWWMEINGYKPPFEIYDENGDYIDGKRPPTEKMDQWYESRIAWKKQNPLPVEMINYCSIDYPMWILAVPNIGIRCHRGDPTPFELRELGDTPESFSANAKAMMEFLTKHNLKYREGPGWFLSSYWG